MDSKLEFYGEVPDWISTGKAALEAWFKTVLAHRGFKLGKLSYTFGDDAWIREQNQRFLQHDYATDIISFDWSKGKRVSGEFLIGRGQIESFARKNKIDVIVEYQRVLIHGILHLIGFNDLSDNEKVEMRKEEDKCLILRPF